MALAAIVAGCVDAWLLSGWDRIDPANLTWLSGDPAVYQAGWEFLRRESHWSFPPTWLPSLHYPFGISAAELDVLPLVSVPLRLVPRLLPLDFQYLGLWSVLCFGLQAYYGFRLSARFSDGDTLLSLFGAIFFLLSPLLAVQLGYGHYSLLAQWVILACTYYYFALMESASAADYLLPYFVLVAITGFISPYITLFSLLFGLSAIARSCTAAGTALHARSNETDGTIGNAYRANVVHSPGVRCLFWALGLVACTVTAWLLAGFFAPGTHAQLSGDGYTVFSTNLLSLIDPGQTSLFLRQYGSLPGQYEGYGYLGLGVLLLGFIAVVRRPALLGRLISPGILPLFVMGALCFLLALSVKITIGRITLFELPVPRAVFNMLAIFRSSGRLLWPAYYLLVLAAIAGAVAAIPSHGARRGVFFVCLLLQFIDLMPLRTEVSTEARVEYDNPLKSADWASISRLHRHLVILPAYQCGPDATPGGPEAWPYFARLAARGRMTLNSVHAARNPAETYQFDCESMPEQLVTRALQRDTAYVLGNDFALVASSRDGLQHYCRRVDGLNLCTYDPSRAPQSRILSQQLLPPYKLGTTFRAQERPPASMILANFDMKPAVARWTIGHLAALYVRLASAPKCDLQLQLTFATRGALLNRNHTLQRAFISVNRHPIDRLFFSLKGKNDKRTVIIPRALVGTQITAIQFALPDAVSPFELGTGNDTRLLGLYISSVRITSAGAGAVLHRNKAAATGK